MNTTHIKGSTSHAIRSRVFLAGVILGNPKKDCAGSGICRVTLGPDARLIPCGCPTIPATIKVKDRNQLHFLFKESDLSTTQARIILSRSILSLSSRVGLPSEITEALGSTQAFLATGRYPIKRRGKFISVCLRVESLF